MNAESPRPFILLNMAISADGRIATADRRFAAFGSRKDHDHLLDLRTTADAVLCGARTVDSADVDLAAGSDAHVRRRMRKGLAPQPLRVVVTGRGSLDPDAAVFRRGDAPIVLLLTENARDRNRRRLEALADHVLAFGRERLDWTAALACLHGRFGVRRLLCEGGGELNWTLFENDLVDELHLTVCPWIVGGRNAPSLADGRGWDRLADTRWLHRTSIRRNGDEVFLRFARVPPGR